MSCDTQGGYITCFNIGTIYDFVACRKSRWSGNFGQELPSNFHHLLTQLRPSLSSSATMSVRLVVNLSAIGSLTSHAHWEKYDEMSTAIFGHDGGRPIILWAKMNTKYNHCHFFRTEFYKIYTSQTRPPAHLTHVLDHSASEQAQHYPDSKISRRVNFFPSFPFPCAYSFTSKQYVPCSSFPFVYYFPLSPFRSSYFFLLSMCTSLFIFLLPSLRRMNAAAAPQMITDAREERARLRDLRPCKRLHVHIRIRRYVLYNIMFVVEFTL